MYFRFIYKFFSNQKSQDGGRMSARAHIHTQQFARHFSDDRTAKRMNENCTDLANGNVYWSKRNDLNSIERKMCCSIWIRIIWRWCGDKHVVDGFIFMCTSSSRQCDVSNLKNGYNEPSSIKINFEHRINKTENRSQRVFNSQNAYSWYQIENNWINYARNASFWVPVKNGRWNDLIG